MKVTLECNQDKRKKKEKNRWAAVVLKNITEFASCLSIPGMEVITVRNASIACTRDKNRQIEVRIKNNNDNNRDIKLKQETSIN